MQYVVSCLWFLFNAKICLGMSRNKNGVEIKWCRDKNGVGIKMVKE